MRNASWLMAKQIASAGVIWKSRIPLFITRNRGAGAQGWSVGIERPYDLVLGLERSYKSQEANLGKPSSAHGNRAELKLAQSET